jgi:hypothetical protein
MARTTRTTQPYSFDDLDHRQFEDLARQLARRMELDWVRVEPVGRLGSDRGRDIRGIERVPPTSADSGDTEREWRFQVKRQREVGPATLRRIVQEAIPDPSDVPHAVIAVVAADVSSDGFDAFHDEAEKRSVAVHEIWSRAALNDMLLEPGNVDLRAFYFGDGHAIDGTVQIPLGLDASPGRDAELVGREQVAESVRSHDGDLILVGVPGSGKTRLVLEARDVRFVNHEAGTDDIADSIRRHHPAHIAIDDAGLDVARLKTLAELRRAGYQFSIIATSWPDDLDEIKRWMPGAVVVHVDLLERKPMDDIVRALGITNYYLRGEILDQAKGRPGWAVALAELAKRGRAADVLTGAALIQQVGPYLRRLGASSAEALGLLSVMAALGQVATSEMTTVDDFLRIDRLRRHHLVQDAASGGFLEPVRDGLRVAPDSMRFALVAHWFFEQPAAWPIGDVIQAWPTHTEQIAASVVNAAAMGSDRARALLDEIVPDLTALPRDALERYTALDGAAADRALTQTAALGPDHYLRHAVLSVAARRYAHRDAVRALLDSAIGDERAEHSNPDHPIRLLGEVGSRIDPHGDTSFAARGPILEIATGWFDKEPSPQHGIVWAKLMVHLLDPRAEGNYQDLGSPMKIQMQSGFEAPQRLQSIISELWPQVERRLHRLDAPALVALVDLADQWVRVARGLEGAFGVKPPAEAISIAAPFSSAVMRALAEASRGKPAAQTALKDVSRMFGVPLQQTIDPEFRLLTWRPWRALRRGARGQLAAMIGRFADCWAAEEPDTLMARLAKHSAEVRDRGQDLAPMIFYAMEALADRVDDVDPLIVAGMRHGLTYELRALLVASLSRSNGAPPWVEPAFASTLRSEAIMAATAPGANEDAARQALDVLGDSDLFLVEGMMIERARKEEPDWVSRALLSHPHTNVRGIASLWWGLDPSDHAVQLPPDWYAEWAEAFSVTPLASVRGGDNHRLGELLARLVERDPDLVERWLTARLGENVFQTLHHVPHRAESLLRTLPLAHRDRLIRQFGAEAGAASLLGQLLGDDDGEWVGRLIDDKVVEPRDVLHALTQFDDADEVKARRATGLASTLMARGVPPESLARTAMFGTWMGEESSRYESLRLAFHGIKAASSEAAAVRRAGIAIYEAMRDRAQATERQERIEGRL